MPFSPGDSVRPIKNFQYIRPTRIDTSSPLLGVEVSRGDTLTVLECSPDTGELFVKTPSGFMGWTKEDSLERT